jgi:hypothetical protein
VVWREAIFHAKHPGLRVSELELRGLDLLLEACRVVEDGRMAVNCYALEELLPRLTEKKRNPVCFHGGNEARKKKKLGLSCSWKKLLEWLLAALDRVSTFGFKCARLGLKPKRGNGARTKAMVKKISAGLGSSSVDSDPGFLGFSIGLEPGSVPAQPKSVSGDSGIQQLGSS